MSWDGVKWQAELGRLTSAQAALDREASKLLVRGTLAEAIEAAQQADALQLLIEEHLNAGKSRLSPAAGSAAVNPECKASKHHNCNGSAMCGDRDCDAIHGCDCGCHSEAAPKHEKGMTTS